MNNHLEIKQGYNDLPLSQEQISLWENQGYIILRGFFDQQDIHTFNEFINSLWDTRSNNKHALAVDVDLNTPNAKRISFSKANIDAKSRPYKLNDLYVNYPEVRQLCLAPKLTAVIKQLLSGQPTVINTLSMEFGTQQPDHIDTFFMPPRVENKMLASWIALDKTHDDNGPLQFYPGSHKIPPYRFSHGKLNAVGNEMNAFYQYIRPELKKRNIKPICFYAEPGDVLLWHAQLLHGGTPIKQMTTRRSLVTHYFRKQDMLNRFWRLRKHTKNGYYLKRGHQATSM